MTKGVTIGCAASQPKKTKLLTKLQNKNCEIWQKLLDLFLNVINGIKNRIKIEKNIA